MQARKAAYKNTAQFSNSILQDILSTPKNQTYN